MLRHIAAIVLSIGFGHIAKASFVLGPDAILPNSKANLTQLLELQQVVSSEIANKNDNQKSIEVINRALSQMKLPLIDDSSPDLKIMVTSSHGFMPGPPLGVQILDGQHRFCLPCDLSWNDLHWGVVDWAKSPRNSAAKYFNFINAIAATQEYERNGEVNWGDYPAKRRALVILNTHIAKGTLVVFDDSIQFFQTRIPKQDEVLPPEYTLVGVDNFRESMQIRRSYPEGKYLSAEQTTDLYAQKVKNKKIDTAIADEAIIQLLTDKLAEIGPINFKRSCEKLTSFVAIPTEQYAIRPVQKSAYITLQKQILEACAK